MSDHEVELPADRGGYVLLTEEPNLHRAHLVAGALNASGIPTFVDEDNLVDEWAMSQKLMGVLGVRVLVPGAQLAASNQSPVAVGPVLHAVLRLVLGVDLGSLR
jgi:hypothetical protein